MRLGTCLANWHEPAAAPAPAQFRAGAVVLDEAANAPKPFKFLGLIQINAKLTRQSLCCPALGGARHGDQKGHSTFEPEREATFETFGSGKNGQKDRAGNRRHSTAHHGAAPKDHAETSNHLAGAACLVG